MEDFPCGKTPRLLILRTVSPWKLGGRPALLIVILAHYPPPYHSILGSDGLGMPLSVAPTTIQSNFAFSPRLGGPRYPVGSGRILWGNCVVKVPMDRLQDLEARTPQLLVPNSVQRIYEVG